MGDDANGPVVHQAPPGRLIHVEEERLRRVLGETLPRIRAERQGPGLIGPVGVLITVIVVLPTSRFAFEGHVAGLDADQWRTLITWLFRGALAWLAGSALYTWHRRAGGPGITADAVVEAIVDDTVIVAPVRRRLSLRPSPSGRPTAGEALTEPDQFKAGLRVRHDSYGPGAVASVQLDLPDPTVTIRFDRPGQASKSFVVSMGSLRRGS